LWWRRKIGSKLGFGNHIPKKLHMYIEKEVEKLVIDIAQKGHYYPFLLTFWSKMILIMKNILKVVF